MSIQFIWEDKYSVGDPVIDQQHMGMFELANQLPEVCDSSDVKPIIMKLYKYVHAHFSAEEEMMKSIGFPQLAEHKLLHEDLITQLNDLSSQPLDTDEAVYGFKKFVYNWLIDHILEEDNKYFLFIENRK
jgi:hemerythrin